MKKFIVAVIALAFIFAVPTMAKNPKSPADYNGLNQGKSDTCHLYLYEKDPTSWEIVENGAWGKMTFKEDRFVFNGHGLVEGKEYTLVNNAEYHSGTSLGTAIADEYGNVHIAGETTGITGKVWLILTSDETSGWHPSEYLFENNII